MPYARSKRTVASFELPPAPARAGIVPPDSPQLDRLQVDQLRRLLVDHGVEPFETPRVGDEACKLREGVERRVECLSDVLWRGTRRDDVAAFASRVCS